MTFSIVIPVYNVAPYLHECLDSVCAAVEKVEKLKGFKVEELCGGVEVICVDDGSTDGSAEILDEYASRFNSSTLKPFNLETFDNVSKLGMTYRKTAHLRTVAASATGVVTAASEAQNATRSAAVGNVAIHGMSVLASPCQRQSRRPRRYGFPSTTLRHYQTFQLFNFSTFKVVHQPNQGVAVARQVALEMCTGEWIAAVDPDDWVEPDYFARLLEATVAEDVDMVWCGFTEEREDGARVVRQEIAPDFKTQVLALLDGSLWGGMWMRLINRQFIVRHQLSFPKIRIVNCEDTLFVASVLAAGARVKYADAVGYHYRIRTGSSVHRKGNLQMYLSLMAIADQMEMALRDDWAAEPLRIWRKEQLRSPYLDESIPDDVFFAHNGGCRDLWSSRVPLHHKLMYWFAARGWRRSLIRMVALIRKWGNGK